MHNTPCGIGDNGRIRYCLQDNIENAVSRVVTFGCVVAHETRRMGSPHIPANPDSSMHAVFMIYVPLALC